MPNARFTLQALEELTLPQRDSIVRMLRNEHIRGIDVQLGGFDLPDGYLFFRKDYADGSTPLYGGISPEGDVST